MFKKTLFLCQVIVLFTFASQVQAQATFTDMRVDYNFGEVIIFNAMLISDRPIFQGLIFFTVRDTGEQFVRPAEIKAINEAQYYLSYLVDQEQIALPAFTEVEYYFQVMLEDGEIIHSPIEQFEYLDNRFIWQEITQLPFQVYWVLGDKKFAQRILDAATAGTRHIDNILSISHLKPIDIYVYPGVAEMQGALASSNPDWIVGHAQVGSSKIIVSLPSEAAKQALIDQRIPHELMHIYLSDTLGEGYTNLPIWLTEGLASFAELRPNPDYDLFLEQAYQANHLLPLSSLCVSFPIDAVDALGSYAQSTSMVAYIYKEYGRQGLEKLIKQYADGADCEEGMQLALGIGLSQIERRWRQDQFGENIVLVSIKQLLPWFLLFVIIMVVPISLLIYWSRKNHLHSEEKI